jgi:hypothetical protein
VFQYEDRPAHRRWSIRGVAWPTQAGRAAGVTPDHRAAKVAAVHGKRAKLHEKRQQVLNLGADPLSLHTELTHREPKLAGRRVEELYVLLEK